MYIGYNKTNPNVRKEEWSFGVVAVSEAGSSYSEPAPYTSFKMMTL